MNDKINRGQLVRTYIGEGLAPFKFEYKGYQGDSWKFERNMKGAVQTISIYPYRFDQSTQTDVYNRSPTIVGAEPTSW